MDQPELAPTGGQDDQELAFGELVVQDGLLRSTTQPMIEEMMAAVSREAMADRLREQGFGNIDSRPRVPSRPVDEDRSQLARDTAEHLRALEPADSAGYRVIAAHLRRAGIIPAMSDPDLRVGSHRTRISYALACTLVDMNAGPQEPTAAAGYDQENIRWHAMVLQHEATPLPLPPED